MVNFDDQPIGSYGDGGAGEWRHYVVIALAHDVLGSHKKFFERRRDAALQEDWFASASGALEQREVLHVAGADLDDISILVDQVERFVIDGLGDDEQAEAV